MQVMKELQRFRLKQKGLDKLNQQHSKSVKDVEESLNAAKNTIQNLYEEYDNEIDTKGSQYLKDLRIEVRNIENILSQEGYVTIDEHRKIITEIQEKLPESSDWIEYDLINGAIKIGIIKLKDKMVLIALIKSFNIKTTRK